MKLFFPTADPQKIISDIGEILSGRALGEIVSVELHGKDLEVIFTKLGRSNIYFEHTEKDGGLEYVMTREKIAFAHRPFKDDIVKKFETVVGKAGGSVSEE